MADLPALVFAQEYRTEFVTLGAGLVKPDYLQDGPCAADLPMFLGVGLTTATAKARTEPPSSP